MWEQRSFLKINLVLEASVEPICNKEMLIILLASRFQTWEILKVVFVKLLHHFYFSLDRSCIKAHLAHNVFIIRIIYTTSYSAILATNHSSIYDSSIRNNHEISILW